MVANASTLKNGPLTGFFSGQDKTPASEVHVGMEVMLEWKPRHRQVHNDSQAAVEAFRENPFSQIGAVQAYTDLIWAEDMATPGRDQSADSAAGMTGGTGRSCNDILARKR
jgi:hypothetical protein